jgi:parvulin-like peptidyl-prolyl isomerase
LNQLDGNADASAMGDTILLEHQFEAMPTRDVTKQFGAEFAAKLAELSPGQWHGPIESGFGLHLVRVDERREGGAPALADVRDVVRREWENVRRQEANEKFYQELLKRYSVTIESQNTAVEKKLAEAK